MVWRCTRDGKFSVKNAYHLMNEVVDMVRGKTSAKVQNWTLWASIWKIRAPNAYKMLLWRVSLESLPTKLNLFKRKVVDAPYCPVCLTEEETVSHALWSCRSVQDIWGSSSRKLQKFQTVETPFPELIFLLFNALDEEMMQEVAATIYQIWRRRNKVIFEHKFASPTEVVMLAQQAVIDFQEANQGRSGALTRQTQPEVQWSAPPPNYHKVNWDAAVDKIRCRIGMGVVIRDSVGNILASLQSQRDSFPDAQLAESMAVLRAINLCRQLGIDHIILEGDAQLVVKAIQDNNDTWNTTGMIIRDIKNILTEFNSWSISFIPRVCNQVAHNLARDALNLSKESIVLEGLPPCIHPS